MDDVGVDELLRYSLKFFISLDLIQSTAFKQRDQNQSKEGNWLPRFLSFHQETPRLFGQFWGEVKDSFQAVRQNDQFGTAPRFWKGAGDEVIFVKEIQTQIDLLAAAVCGLLVIRKINADFQSKNVDLKVKAAAWLAGFPITNCEVAIIDSPNEAPSEDNTIFENLKNIYRSRVEPDSYKISLD